jgi:glycine dehydrogenase
MSVYPEPSTDPVVPGAFSARHIGPRSDAQAKMLATIGVESIEALLDTAIPESIRMRHPLQLGPALSEAEALSSLEQLAAKNTVMTSMIGQGYYGTLTPEVIRRNVFENPAWYTAYTPYQPEISQGRLELLLRFQTMVCELTGMDVAGASLLDDATAAAEAMTMALRLTKSKSHRFVVDHHLHPQVIDVIKTRAVPLGIEIVVTEPSADAIQDSFGVVVAHLATTGAIATHRDMITAAKAAGVFVCVHTDLLACMLLDGPGSWGADAVVGSAQRFGVPMFAGGPHAGFLAVTDAHKRSLPGRLVGVSVDAAGRRAYRLTLQTREQHIRREKATSNICTAQVLLAVGSALYACWHGQQGLHAIAQQVHMHTSEIAAALQSAGFELGHATWFDTITVRIATSKEADNIVERAVEAGINVRRINATSIGISCDELTDVTTVQAVLASFGASPTGSAPTGIPTEYLRSSEALRHEVFHREMSETDMLRELRRLSDRDLALDRTMIPLGSCTMKLNATTEMVPVTWPAFANLHPFAPAHQLAGTQQLVSELEAMLVEITGYDRVSLQPNAGSQGEFAGLLAIRGYHQSRGDHDRTVCLIPTSAHGTNAASAVMAGMSVVTVKCDDAGNVDVDDLESKISTHSSKLAALMVTYPSTHGVFEERIVEICEKVHAAGGQVYLDGANFNALVGTAQPGKFGADVSHLNLHKTFCIPHGGGGPGVGPVCVRQHLAPFLPSHLQMPDLVNGPGVGAVSAAPWGSAGILAIPWAYISMMGADGLLAATSLAILNANYIATRLGASYPVLYTGHGGRVAHECILDIRPITAATGITVDDVAKRLIDYGFHAPTMSFPVSGTLMVEPTESESLHELDRFCDAMIAIRHEIDRVAAGEWPADDNPLVHAPHTADDVLLSEWNHSYSRREAAAPTGKSMADKYWPPVSRIDGTYGDRNVVCSCPPLEDYA